MGFLSRILPAAARGRLFIGKYKALYLNIESASLKIQRKYFLILLYRERLGKIIWIAQACPYYLVSDSGLLTVLLLIFDDG